MTMVVLYHFPAFAILFAYGIHHVIAAARSHLRIPTPSSSPRDHAVGPPYAARLYHPLPLLQHRHLILRHLPLTAALLLLLSNAAVHAFPSSTAAPLRLASFQSVTAILLLSLPLLASASATPILPHDILFLVAAVAFALLSSSSMASAAAHPASDLQSRALSLSSLVSSASAASSLALAISPRLLPADLSFGATISLHGLWTLQTSLSLYTDAFIPKGCHRLLEEPAITRCDLEGLRLRAYAILDLTFAIHVVLVSIIAAVVYAAVAKFYSATAGGLARRYGG